MNSILYYQKENQMRPQPLWTVESGTNEFYLITDWSVEKDTEALLQILKAPAAVSVSDETQLAVQSLSLPEADSEDQINAKLKAVNDYLLEINKKKYQAMIEIVAGTFKSKTLIWGQVGQPHLVLKRNKIFYPLSLVARDFSLGSKTSPLALHTLGVDFNINPVFGQFETEKNDEIFFLFHSQPQFDFFTAGLDSIQDIYSNIISKNSDTPFCLGNFKDFLVP